MLVGRSLRFRRTLAAAPPFPVKLLRTFTGALFFSALVGGTARSREILISKQNRRGETSPRRFWSRRRDLRLWRRAPVHTTPWCAVCVRSSLFLFFSRKRLAHARPSTLKSRRTSFSIPKNRADKCLLCFLVEATGFEPTTSWSRTKRATKLRYASTAFLL